MKDPYTESFRPDVDPDAEWWTHALRARDNELALLRIAKDELEHELEGQVWRQGKLIEDNETLLAELERHRALVRDVQAAAVGFDHGIIEFTPDSVLVAILRDHGFGPAMCVCGAELDSVECKSRGHLRGPDTVGDGA